MAAGSMTPSARSASRWASRSGARSSWAAGPASPSLAGTPAATGGRPRQLLEAASSGNLDRRWPVPPGARPAVANAAREGFLSGLN